MTLANFLTRLPINIFYFLDIQVQIYYFVAVVIARSYPEIFI